jgi:hypothetical protein
MGVAHRGHRYAGFKLELVERSACGTRASLATARDRGVKMGLNKAGKRDLEKIQVESCPFSNLPAPGRNRWDQGLTAADIKTLSLGEAENGLPGEIHRMDSG